MLYVENGLKSSVITLVKISVIIPVVNEGYTIQTTLHQIQQAKTAVEIIVVDGGSTDNTVELAETNGAKVLFSSQAGRAIQMNLGATQATGEVLLFVHGDTFLPNGYASMIEAMLSDPTTVAGAFCLSIDGDWLSLRLVEKLVNWRSRFFNFPYGDQAIFLKASTFHSLGGFPNLPIMEDFELVRQLRRKGKIALTSASVITSGRRWQKLGVWRTTLINQIIILGYLGGVKPERLVDWYQGMGRKKEDGRVNKLFSGR